MYNECDRCKTTKPHPKFFIPRSEIEFDPRVAYIESVCTTLVESRFGPGRVDTILIDLGDRPELEPAVFYDLCEGVPDGRVPCYTLSPQGRAGYQVIEAAYRRAKQRSLVDVGSAVRHSPSDLTQNQGRGSP